MTGEVKLKACPFCGGEAKNASIGGVTFYAVCSRCGAGIESYMSKPEAIAAWNLRTPEAQKTRDDQDDGMPGFSPKLQEALDAWYRRKTPEPGTSVVCEEDNEDEWDIFQKKM